MASHAFDADNAPHGRCGLPSIKLSGLARIGGALLSLRQPSARTYAHPLRIPAASYARPVCRWKDLGPPLKTCQRGSLGDHGPVSGDGLSSNAGEDMGRIVDVIVGRDGRIHAAIIDFGGLLGIGTRKIAVDWRALNFAPAGKPGSITLEFTRNQVRLAPEYKRGEPVVVIGAAGAERTMPSSEVAAPER